MIKYHKAVHNSQYMFIQMYKINYTQNIKLKILYHVTTQVIRGIHFSTRPSDTVNRLRKEGKQDSLTHISQER